MGQEPPEGFEAPPDEPDEPDDPEAEPDEPDDPEAEPDEPDDPEVPPEEPDGLEVPPEEPDGLEVLPEGLRVDALPDDLRAVDAAPGFGLDALLDDFAFEAVPDDPRVAAAPEDFGLDPAAEELRLDAPPDDLPPEAVPDDLRVEPAPDDFEAVPDEREADDPRVDAVPDPRVALVLDDPRADRVLDDPRADPVLDDRVFDAVPDDRLFDAVPDDRVFEAVPDDRLFDAVPDDRLFDAVPDDRLFDAVPDDRVFEAVPDDRVFEAVPDDRVLDAVPDDRRADPALDPPEERVVLVVDEPRPDEDVRLPVRVSRTPTRRPRSCTWSRTCSSVSTRRASRICWTVPTSSSSSCCARLPVAAAPPAAPANVRSTASRSVSAAPAPFPCLSVFFAMAGKHTPIHLRPHLPVAERVIAPGDPGRALRLAQELIDGPKMLNHHRGLWGYSGPARVDGAPLTVQSTGLGGPGSAAIVADLAVLGARRLVRVGSCRAVDPGLPLGALVVAECVVAPDGERLEPDAEMSSGLLAALPHASAVTVASLDWAHARAPAGVPARDMSSAGVLGAARRAGVRAAVAAMAASSGDDVLPDDRLHAAEVELGRAALRVLAVQDPPVRPRRAPRAAA